jgi:two-component system NarL family sensor kinase
MWGQRVIFFLFSFSVLLIAALFGLLIYTVPKVHRQRGLLHKNQLAEAEDRLKRQIVLSQLEIQEAVVKRISMELHDNIGQKIYLSKLYLSSFAMDPSMLVQKAAFVEQLLDQTADDLRDLLGNMSLDLIRKNGVRTAIWSLVSQLSRTSVYDIVLIERHDGNLNNDQEEIVLFRIVQEIVNNIVRHALALKIDIGLLWGNATYDIWIRDDGVGFDNHLCEQEKVSHPSGMGLRSMRERAQLIGASLLVESTIGKGTTIRIIKSK